ncbi:FmdB family zinc ribbon protein [Chrysiogenes arsenatis]|uniref:FmdB family zinc ribbon protein n=1 Tax=Chrysiogenes arsenatis TaxID=309797 RepID=UPI00041724B4|nr:zinc ribbon domain-containing protein [Chrysiogenes arsenatis]
MPIYEYTCHECGKTFEKIEKMDAPKETACVTCSGTAHRILSLAAFSLKGSGWYSDGYSANAQPKCSPEKVESCGCAASGCPAAAAQ